MSSTTPASQRPLRYCSFIDVGNVLNVSFDSGSNPTEHQVTDMIDKADSWVDSATGHSWHTLQATDEIHDGPVWPHRRGRILVKNRPLLSVVKAEYYDTGTAKWTEGVNALPNDSTIGTKYAYHVYPDQGIIQWRSGIREGEQVYRVTYNYGYATVPDYIRDLSARKAALLVLDFWGGKFQPADTGLRDRLLGEVQDLLYQARRYGSRLAGVAG